MKAHVIAGQHFEAIIHTFEVRCKSSKDCITQAGYAEVLPDILRVADTLIHNPGSHHVMIWDPREDLNLMIANRFIRSLVAVINGNIFKGRPATIEELASYEVSFREVLGNTTLLALGEIICNGGPTDKFFAYRHIGARGPKLDFCRWPLCGPPFAQHLVVFEQISS